MQRRDFLKAVGMGTIALAVSPQKVLSQFTKEPQEEKFPLDEILKKFESLPKQKQNEVLQKAESFGMNTLYGRMLSGILQQVDVKENLEQSLDELSPYKYDEFTNKISYREISNSSKAREFLRGNVYPLSIRAHERLHYVQDTSSKWDRLETFIQQESTTDPHERVTIEFNQKSANKFAQRVLLGEYAKAVKEGKNISTEFAANAFSQVWKEYDGKKYLDMMMGEIQAYVITYALIDVKKLYRQIKESAVSEGDVGKANYIWINRASTADFEKIFQGTVQLIGMQDPMKPMLLNPVFIAKIGGMHSRSPDDYIKEIENIGKQLNINASDAFDRGIKVQQDYIADQISMKNEFARLVNMYSK